MSMYTDTAIHRATEFFQSLLTPAQLDVFLTRKYVDVAAPNGGKFRIACGHQTDVMRVLPDNLRQWGCIHLNFYAYPIPDTWIAQYLMIKAAPEEFIRTANWGNPYEADYWAKRYTGTDRLLYAYAIDEWKDLS